MTTFGDLLPDERVLLTDILGHEDIFDTAPVAELLRRVQEDQERDARRWTRLERLHQRDDRECRHCRVAFPCPTLKAMRRR